MNIDTKNIDTNIQTYQSALNATDRYASFDYCFNYFQQFKETNTVAHMARPEHVQMSCLQLGFYLASWGMFRGSTVLLRKSAKYLEHLIDGLAHCTPEIWHIDVDSYDEATIALLFDCKTMIQNNLMKHALPIDSPPSDTLTTKIMLGVFGNVPAFDAYFKRGFKVHGFNKHAIKRISAFYQQHQTRIDSYDIKTVDFITGKLTQRRYTKAKIIDMVGFIEGYHT